MLGVSCSSVRALQNRGRKEAHARQSDSARPSTGVPMPELRVAKPKPGPLEVLDADTSDEEKPIKNVGENCASAIDDADFSCA